MELLKSHKCFSGQVEIWQHASQETKTPMTFSIFRPSQTGPRPMLIWLSGLTCTHENFFHKAGAFETAGRLGMILVAPDTSPRNTGIVGEDADWQFGSGAGFYVDATQKPWNNHYRMFSYISRELRGLLVEQFDADNDRVSLSGHSMGGHGALVMGLREPERYRSISALAPICAPTSSPLGQKAFAGYLQPGEGKHWDACELAKGKKSWTLPDILIDQGTEDEFYLEGKLQPERFREACSAGGIGLKLRFQKGFDHSYYFVASFIQEHLEFSQRCLD